jgi:hypothetical protein
MIIIPRWHSKGAMIGSAASEGEETDPPRSGSVPSQGGQGAYPRMVSSRDKGDPRRGGQAQERARRRT